MISTEKVLVVPRALFDELGSFQGLNSDRSAVEHYLATFLDPKNHSFMLRSEAEENPAFKQIIPYIVITAGDRILHYRRGSGTGETRLLKKRSVGIGGHMNDEDGAGSSFDAAAYQRALLRELEEELILPPSFQSGIMKPLALLNDDSNAVGAVHLGIVHQCVLDSEEVAPNEEAIAELGFLSPAELLERHDELESWSQIVVKGWKNFGKS